MVKWLLTVVTSASLMVAGMIGLLELFVTQEAYFSPPILITMGTIPGIVLGIVLITITVTGAIASRKPGLGRSQPWDRAAAVAVGISLGILSAEYVLTNVLLRDPNGRYGRLALHSTRFSERFEERRFIEIDVGISREQVIGIMGSPLRTFIHNGSEHLAYSDIGEYSSLSNKGYFQRWVVVEDDHVTRIYRRYISAD